MVSERPGPAWRADAVAIAVGWGAAVAAEATIGRPLVDPPALLPVVAELGLACLIAAAHAAVVRARPGTAAGLPELPAVLTAAAWGAAASVSDAAPIPGGGAPDTGGLASAALAALVVACGVLVSSWIPLASGRAAVARAALAAPVAAMVALIVAGRTDPSWHPSQVMFGPVAAGLGLAIAGAVLVALAGALRPWLGLPVAAGLALAATAPPWVDRGSPGPLIVLVTVDTLRTDVADSMASVRRLASRGERFDDALAASSWTVPSMASVLTGRWPQAHGAGRPGRGWPGIGGADPAIPTVQGRLQAAGWRTGASVANAFLVPVLGFHRGWDAYLHADAVPRAPLLGAWLAGRTAGGERHGAHRDDGAAVVDRALAWWDQGRSQPTLLWVHLLDPHTPYHHAVLGPDHPLFPVVGAVPGEDLDATAIRRGEVRDGPRERAAVAALYADEVAYADRAVQRLLDGLEARGALDTATIVFTSDHGEELWEHGGFEHGHALWPEVTRVPLVLVHPQGTPGRVRAEPASGVDVAATVLAAAGLGAGDLDGVDLRRPVPPDRVRRIQGTLYFRQQQAVIRGDHALVEVDGEALRLYDRAADPGWTEDRAAGSPALVERLRPSLAPGWADRSEAGPVNLDLEALRALGYVQ